MKQEFTSSTGATWERPEPKNGLVFSLPEGSRETIADNGIIRFNERLYAVPRGADQNEDCFWAIESDPEHNAIRIYHWYGGFIGEQMPVSASEIPELEAETVDIPVEMFTAIMENALTIKSCLSDWDPQSLAEKSSGTIAICAARNICEYMENMKPDEVIV